MKKHYWPQFERIRRILELIREGTRTGALANGTDFSRECGVSWRTAMRDLELLRERERAPIEYDASRKGYYLNDATWSLRPVHLSRSEVFAFTIARKLAAAYRGTPLELDIQSALEKIGESLRGAVSVDLGAVTDRLSILREDYVVQDPEIWGEVARRRVKLAALARGPKTECRQESPARFNCCRSA